MIKIAASLASRARLFLAHRVAAAKGNGPNLGVDPKKFLNSMLPPVPATRGGNDTIVELDAYRHAKKALCIEEGNSQSTPQSALKLFKIKFADDDGRRRSASFLVQRRYAWRGYQVGSHPSQNPNRITLSAYDGDSAVATISVGLDSPSGLFVDTLFPQELGFLRARGSKVCEFTKLAIDEAIKSKVVLAALFHIAYIHARKIRLCSDLVVEVNPRHVKFYERMLGFTPLGPTRMDFRVKAPANLLHLDLAHAEAEIAKFGGKAELGTQIRSLYPFFFSTSEEGGIEARLRTFT